MVAPIACISPLAKAGFIILAASIAPSAAPAPMIVCNSSIKRIIFLFSFTASSNSFKRSSNSPRYFVPATRYPISSENTIFSRSISGTLPSTIRWARPSAIAVLPTPDSPINTGLFFVFLERIRITFRISASRPITGSSLPSLALRFREMQ